MSMIINNIKNINKMNSYIMKFEGLEPIVCFLIIEWVFGGDIIDGECAYKKEKI